MAGTAITDSIILGDSATQSNNFLLKTNLDGSLTLARGSAGNLGNILTVDSNGYVTVTAPLSTDNTTKIATTQFARSLDIGIDQTWQSVSRSQGVDYTNSTDKPIMVAVSFGHQSNYISTTVIVDGITIAYWQNITPGGSQVSGGSFSFIVPAGAVYRVNSSGNQYAWAELRS